jgi:hypothetical protein
MKGPRSHSYGNAQIISFRLVFYITEGASLPYFQYNYVLRVSDWYYMQVC